MQTGYNMSSDRKNTIIKKAYAKVNLGLDVIRRREDGYHEVHLKNPTCGDDITVQVKVEDGKLTDLRHQGTGCSICCSSASVMTQTLKEKTLDEAQAITNNFYELVKGNDYDEELDMGDSPVYQGVSKFPARVKCATISWKAAEQAINELKK